MLDWISKLIQFGPQVYAFFKMGLELWKQIQGLNDHPQKMEAMRRIKKNAVKVCVGIGCASDVKTE